MEIPRTETTFVLRQSHLFPAHPMHLVLVIFVGSTSSGRLERSTDHRAHSFNRDTASHMWGSPTPWPIRISFGQQLFLACDELIHYYKSGLLSREQNRRCTRRSNWTPLLVLSRSFYCWKEIPINTVGDGSVCIISFTNYNQRPFSPPSLSLSTDRPINLLPKAQRRKSKGIQGSASENETQNSMRAL